MPDDPLSDEDKALFRHLTQDVKPLRKTKRADLRSQTPKPIALHKPKKILTAEPISSTIIHLSDHYYQEVQTETILSYCNHSIPRKRFQELRSGQIAWQAKLDLHGLKSETAKEALIQFILQQSELKHRCLLIVHGKSGYKGEAPVLKNLVNHWLPQFPQILAFHSAKPQHGGSGALYVLLKRH